MALYTHPDSPEQFQRYLLRIFQKIDKDIYRHADHQRTPRDLNQLLQLKQQTQTIFSAQEWHNLDAFKWELQFKLPDFEKYF